MNKKEVLAASNKRKATNGLYVFTLRQLHENVVYKYFNWTYILCSIAISVLVILLLHQTKQKSNKG